MELRKWQEIIRKTYYQKDKRRGVDLTFIWLVEELGEVAEALRKRDKEKLKEELSDLLAWTMSLANLLDIDLEEAMDRYRNGCPKCGRIPCVCGEEIRDI